jgi:hypothetical protein
MMKSIIVILLCSLIFPANAINFTIINGQIFTPGLAIIDAPQPNTPLGGGAYNLFQFSNASTDPKRLPPSRPGHIG